MPNNNLYEVIWNPDAAIDQEEYAVYAKTTTEEIYDISLLKLSTKPYAKGNKVIFKKFEYDGYYWINIRNIILVFEILEEDKIVAIEATYFANNERSAQIFYDIDPNEGWT
ncbi:hypothetical protein M670_03160 [Schinkia azotoformans MEV2011]|uniref:Uncharacterized protein n=1 Tax=Schinkia azotoformans MEV2011 TaxID=1348973 RepID=A0A072NJE5_SCHAZ|nr:hypothetical protein [Schinkia azotoformans]KEF37581.1 hypothetical protein M670_03160 [Schinkia azotoformans MEV2011]MEC1695307.1 hypothetical protein [Schinkia azotoformans]MEC1724669.1 hypothetical protein [Schinkia azotoformans]MEC1778007.1 hypothetical protein [Schinkia azotoformans]MED4330942.1 hypothetical protein [Schinkia azotoformans]